MRTYLIVLLILISGITACQNEAKKSSAGIPEITAAADTTGSGLIIQIIKEGTDEIVKTGDSVKIHYTGWFTDGKQFDSSIPRKKPLALKLGTGSVIPGWEEGILGMKKGEKRRLTIPPHLAYGTKGYPGAIPPNATLIFDIELVWLKSL